MPLMIDLEPLLPFLAAIDASIEPRRMLVTTYEQIVSPSAQQTTKFMDDYLKASIDWFNACGALTTSLCTAVKEAKQCDT